MADVLPDLLLPSTLVPPNEAERLVALRRYKILDTPPEASFDRITSLAARLFDVPIALVSLVDESRAWFKSCHGFALPEVKRDATICSFALLYNDLLIVPDARQDERFVCNPFVQQEPGLRFYAGAPLITHDGYNLGTLCLLDMKPRDSLTDGQRATLADLAAMVVDELELRLAAHKVAQVDAALLEVTKGVSAATGEAFFTALVQQLTKALGINYACISLLSNEQPETLRTIAFWGQGQILDAVEYRALGTPCIEVLRQQKLRCYREGIKALFPEDGFLASLDLESYAGIPFFDSAGKLLGLLSVMDNRPLENPQLVESLLTIFATRIAAELERQQMEDIRQAAAQRLQLYLDVVSNTQVGIVVWQLEDLNDPGSFRLLVANPAASEATGFDFEAVIGERMGDGFPMLMQSPLVQRYMEVVRGGQPVDLGEVSYGEDGIAAGIYSLKAFPLPNRCLGLAFENITVRKQIETQLQESQRYNQQVAETMPGVLFVHDLIEQRNVYTNRQIAELLGYSSEQIQAMGANAIPTLIHPDDLESMLRYFESFQTVPEGEVLGIEYRAHHAKGHWRWLYSQCVVFNRTTEGLPRQILGVSIDISDRIQAEQSLQESEARLKLAYKATRSGLWDWDVKRNRAFISEEYCALFGLDPATKEVSYEQWLSFLHPDDHAVATESVRDAIEQQQEYEVEYRILHPLGIRWVASRGQVFYDETGNATRMLGNVQDITERKRFESEREHLLTRERQYINQLRGLTTAAMTITDSALSVEQVLQVITDQAAAIIEAHQSVTSLTVDQNWVQAINAVYLSDKYAQWRDYDEMPDGSGIYACVCHLNRPVRMTQAELEAHPRWKGFGEASDRHPPMRGWLAAPLVGRDGHNIGLVQLSDKYEGEFTPSDESILVQLAQMASIAIENARLFEAEQQARSAAEASREEAQAANRVKDEFLAVLSHELRSPLNPILGWSALLQNSKLDEAKTAIALATIHRNAKLQSELIEDLLDVSRILQGKLSLDVAPVNLAAVVNAAIETVQLAAEAKSIRLEVSLDPQGGLVSGDATRLQQVVWNLLSNAVKFTAAGGRVTVRLEHQTSHAQITVSDTGRGIAPDFLPYVFDYFRQASSATTRKFGGLGLGLAIVRHLVELHGGRVRAESAGEGQGATFLVRLPLMPTAPPSNPGNPPSERAADLSNISILLVDDDTDTREFVAFLLELQGARVTVATSAYEALQALAQSKPDLLLSDIGMPEMDGYTLIRQVRTLPPEGGGQVPAIAVTAYAGEINQQQALAAGFQKHLSKPIDPNGLVQEIVNLVRSAAS